MFGRSQALAKPILSILNFHEKSTFNLLFDWNTKMFLYTATLCWFNRRKERKKKLNKEIESNAKCQYFECSVYKTTKNCSIENVLFNRQLQNCTMEFDELKTTAIRMNGTATTTKARKEAKRNYYLRH